MEDNNTNMPEFCAAGCGFYANKIYNNMCSKCYKQNSQQSNNEQDKMTPPPPATVAEPSSSQSDASANTFQPSSPAPAPVVFIEPSMAPVAMDVDLTPSVPTVQEQIVVVKASPIVSPAVNIAQAVAQAAAAVASPPPEQPAKPVQSNKGRCFVCRAKIPLAKQTINKCRCEYVFCDNHHYPEKHDCEFDFVTLGKDILAKNNPKLNERPKGGRSFTRIDNS